MSNAALNQVYFLRNVADSKPVKASFFLGSCRSKQVGWRQTFWLKSRGFGNVDYETTNYFWRTQVGWDLDLSVIYPPVCSSQFFGNWIPLLSRTKISSGPVDQTTPKCWGYFPFCLKHIHIYIHTYGHTYKCIYLYLYLYIHTYIWYMYFDM